MTYEQLSCDFSHKERAANWFYIFLIVDQKGTLFKIVNLSV